VLNRVGMVTDISREKAVELLGRPFFLGSAQRP